MREKQPQWIGAIVFILHVSNLLFFLSLFLYTQFNACMKEKDVNGLFIVKILYVVSGLGMDTCGQL